MPRARSSSARESTLTKIRIKFSALARKKIKAAIRDFGPRKAAAAATATDTFGNNSAAKARFNLVAEAADSVRRTGYSGRGYVATGS